MKQINSEAPVYTSKAPVYTVCTNYYAAVHTTTTTVGKERRHRWRGMILRAWKVYSVFLRGAKLPLENARGQF